jgi:uncharacterized protein YjbI with pentapeptide repeats
MLDAHEVRLSSEDLARILQAAPSGDRGPVLQHADFHGATFTGAADFRGARFVGDANFAGARFAGDAHFDGAQFFGDAHFDGAQFSGDAHFDRARFSGEADFRKVQFAAEADLRKLTCTRRARFDEVRFSGQARFGSARFAGDVDVLRASFGTRAVLAPVVVAGTLSLDDATFEEDVRLDVAAAALSCVRTRFGGRADLNVRWAEVALDDAAFVDRSRLVGAGPFSDIDLAPAHVRRLHQPRDARAQPRLLSIRRANVESLAVGNMDLRACRFMGAQGLEQLRIEVNCRFSETPPSWRYTRRRTLAEEHCLRGWTSRTTQSSTDARSGATPTHGDIAAVYRSLRKALEDHKDEPGAADFYYGEMEMRRLTKPSAGKSFGIRLQTLGERLILGLYWLVSGYGLRASRALVALLLTVLMFAVAFDLWGFDGQPFWRCLLFSAQSTTSLFRAPDEPALEPVGEALQLPLRLLGPLFFGLALLSARGRVKR